MGQDRTVVVAAATTLGLAAAAFALVLALRQPSRVSAGSESNSATEIKPPAALLPVASAESAPGRVDTARPNPPPLTPRLQAVLDRDFRDHVDTANAFLADGRFRDADFEIRALQEQRPEKREELEKHLAEIGRLAQAALEEALEAARREPANARTVLASLSARAPEEISKKADRALQQIEDARARESAGKKAAAAETLAAEGKLREAVEELEAAIAMMPEDVAGEARPLLARWKRLARYSGAMDPAKLLAVSAPTLDAVEPAVEEFLACDDIDRRNALSQKLQALPGATPELVAAVVLRGGKLEAIAPGDTVEQFKLPEGETRDIVISVPQGYTPDKLWPVFMNLHGTNATLDFCQGYAPYFRDIARGRWIVVQPVSARKSGWGPMKIGEEQAPAALQYIRSKFSIDPDRVWLAGQSMGAHGTWLQALQHGDRYAAYMPKAGSPNGPHDAKDHMSTPYGLNWIAWLDNLRFAPAYYIHGALDPIFPIQAPREFAKLVSEKKLNVEYHEFANNGHEGAPEDEIRKSFEWATDKVRVPYPKKFGWTADYIDFARYSWVEATRLNPTAKTDNVKFLDQEKKPVEIRAVLEVPVHFDVDVKDQVIELKTKEIEKIKIWWNPAVVDLTKEVTVKVNGKSKWKGVPVVSIKAMLDEAKRTGRRDVVFYGSVEVDAQ